MWTRSFLLLHGVTNRRPAGHWHHRLSLALRERGEQVFYPQLPDTDRPTLEGWTDAIRAELALMRGERIVLAHSLSTIAWLHLAAAEPAPADRVVLVSPPGPSAFDWDVIAPFAFDHLDLGAIRLAEKSARLVVSDADPYRPEGPGYFAERLGIDADIVPGGGHLTLDDGYGEWPSALAWCLDPEARFTADR
ncbi:RBBP9/YdeN family alpha/beta hydrolase [Glycomyces paridis]|uniref:Alpha/beta fold hydrolase n=1 Tax=Glycomyces paridis TaxID=2126555 RepID=A0A4S8P2K5_9ACTN|nr:alpha/beta hydrolase [Glycomyces paridis]THV24307.1 alpha/beta fold hydrolase [Glycomyces paridis]